MIIESFNEFMVAYFFETFMYSLGSTEASEKDYKKQSYGFTI